MIISFVIMAELGLCSLTSDQKQEMVNWMHNMGDGYDFRGDLTRGDVTFICSSKLGKRGTESTKDHRCALRAGELRKHNDQFDLYLVNIREKALREDRCYIAYAAASVLGRKLPNHESILSVLRK